ERRESPQQRRPGQNPRRTPSQEPRQEPSQEPSQEPAQASSLSRSRRPRPRPSRAPSTSASVAEAAAEHTAEHTQEWGGVREGGTAFGTRGELKVRPLTDFPERFSRTPVVYLGDERRRVSVVAARLHGRLVVLRLEDADTVEAAEQLRGVRLWIPAEELLPLP